MNINVQHLTSTGIGRTVNALRKDDGEIGAAAKALISKWKQMVASQESDGEEGDDNGNHDEEELQINYNYECENDDANKAQTESIDNCERKSHKTHEYLPKGSTSTSTSNNNHQHHHRDQNHRHAHAKMSDNHSMDRKVMIFE